MGLSLAVMEWTQSTHHGVYHVCLENIIFNIMLSNEEAGREFCVRIAKCESFNITDLDSIALCAST
jgi:hypothetical protein